MRVWKIVWKGLLVAVIICIAFYFMFTYLSDEVSEISSQLYDKVVNLDISVIEQDEVVTFQDVEKEMKRRNIMIEEVCRRHDLLDPQSEDTNNAYAQMRSDRIASLMYDTKNDLAWCPVPVTAEDSWYYNFCLLGGMTITQMQNVTNFTSKAIELWPPLKQGQFQEAFDNAALRFFIVRHPLERLSYFYSIYFESTDYDEATQNPQAQELEKIVGAKLSRTREDENVRFAPAQKNFEDEANKIFAYYNKDDVSFVEFLEYILSLEFSTVTDSIWQPYFLRCAPCWMKYDVVVKFETISDDQNYIYTMTDLEYLTESQNFGPEYKSTTNLKDYYRNVTKELIYKLQDKYKVDFDMFSYTIDEYLILDNKE